MDLLRSQNFEEIYGEAEIKRQIQIENELKATFKKEKETTLKETEWKLDAKNEENKEENEDSSNFERILGSQNSSNQN